MDFFLKNKSKLNQVRIFTLKKKLFKIKHNYLFYNIDLNLKGEREKKTRINEITILEIPIIFVYVFLNKKKV